MANVRNEPEIRRLSWKYFCAVCLKSTHETGAGESEYHLCLDCFTNTDWAKYLKDGGDICYVPVAHRPKEKSHEQKRTVRRSSKV